MVMELVQVVLLVELSSDARLVRRDLRFEVEARAQVW